MIALSAMGRRDCSSVSLLAYYLFIIVIICFITINYNELVSERQFI